MRHRWRSPVRGARRRAGPITVFWCCAACVLATTTAGFSLGGWTTPGAAARLAERAAQAARTRLAAEICVDQFNRSPEAPTRLASLRNVADWQRVQFMLRNGWISPPIVEAVDGAAASCVDRLVSEEFSASNAAKAKDAGAIPGRIPAPTIARRSAASG